MNILRLVLTVFFMLPIVCFSLPRPELYLGVSGGYAHYQDVKEENAKTGIMRLALGGMFALREPFQLGAEVGIQSGNSMHLKAKTLAPLGDLFLPVLIDESPPVDFLIVGKFQYQNPYFLIGKIGVAHINAPVESSTINSKPVNMLEAQIGVGGNISDRSRLVVYYQQLFGKSFALTQINEDDGTAVLRHLPSQGTVFLSIEITL